MGAAANSREQMPGKRAGLKILPELDRIHARMLKLGWPTRIAQGLRTIDDQIRLYAKGRTFQQFRDHLDEAVATGHLATELADRWIAYFDPAREGHAMPPGEPGPVTWTLQSRHLLGEAADVVHAQLGWYAPARFWEDLRAAAEAEGLQVGPPAGDLAHVRRP
jgi:hypothetical protein